MLDTTNQNTPSSENLNSMSSSSVLNNRGTGVAKVNNSTSMTEQEVNNLFTRFDKVQADYKAIPKRQKGKILDEYHVLMALKRRVTNYILTDKSHGALAGLLSNIMKLEDEMEEVLGNQLVF